MLLVSSIVGCSRISARVSRAVISEQALEVCSNICVWEYGEIATECRLQPNEVPPYSHTLTILCFLAARGLLFIYFYCAGSESAEREGGDGSTPSLSAYVHKCVHFYFLCIFLFFMYFLIYLRAAYKCWSGKRYRSPLPF